tara:strand:+ start:175 stop:429 length:255 start_codon:yes stop_codon:yes gene_type:complete
MKVQNFHTYDMYYDPEGDFLEIIFGLSPDDGYSEEIEPGVFIHRVEDTEEIYGVGIINFKKRPHLLQEIFNKINVSFPLKIEKA